MNQRQNKPFLRMMKTGKQDVYPFVTDNNETDRKVINQR